MKKSYSELLKDPRWQKKRLEILQRDNFFCQSCGDSKNTLHVHHASYDDSLLPWEFENEDLITLCEVCHKTWHYTYGNENLDPCVISMVARLYDKLESDSINRSIEKHKNGL